MKSFAIITLLIGLLLAMPMNYLQANKSGVVGKPFPPITTQTLSGDPITLPSDSKTKATVIMIAFEQKTQLKIDSWTDTLFKQYDIDQTLGFYEVPMISGFYSFMSGIIDGGMRGGIIKSLHDNVATFYGDREPYKQALNITDMSECYLYVLNNEGIIVQHETGYSDFQKLDRLFLTIDKLLNAGDSLKTR